MSIEGSKNKSYRGWSICQCTQGFTLVEMMVALVMTVFLMGSAILMYSSGRKTTLDAAQLSRMQENIRFASDYLIRDIRNAGFRDETFLKLGHELQIRSQYADILNDGTTLRLRYAGRGHCQQAFNEFRLIENEYTVNTATGELTCRGRSIPQSDGGEVLVKDQPFSPAVGLVSGMTGIAFQFVCPDGTATCPCNLVDDPDTSCIGVQIGLPFRGMRAIDGSANFDDRSVELTAAFRNVILDRMNTFRFEESSP